MSTHEPFIKVETDVGKVHIHAVLVVSISTSCLVIIYLNMRGTAGRTREKLD